MAEFRNQNIFDTVSFQAENEDNYILTPFIITFREGLTDIDMQSFLEAGLRIVRFHASLLSKREKLKLLGMLRTAIKQCCEKYNVTNWPVAVIVDLPNACIRTGFVCEDISASSTYLATDSVVEVTCNTRYWNKCNSKRIFIDDAYTMKTIKVNTELSINFGTIHLICVEVIDDQNIKCKVTVGGVLGNGQFVCIRGMKYRRPSVTRQDKQLIAFVKELEIDAVMINLIRSAETIFRIRELFVDSPMPLILCSICDEEGLDNIDSIIKAADGIVLAREFLSEALTERCRVAATQLHISAKCKQAGKPFFVSGSVLEETMRHGTVCSKEVSDVTNAISQGGGLVFAGYVSPGYVLASIRVLGDLCKTAELTSQSDDFWRMVVEPQPPVNAAEAAVLACAIAARQSGAAVIVVLTVSGATAVQLTRVAPEAVILAVATDHRVANQLQLYRGIVPVVYDQKVKQDWYTDMNLRIQCALKYGVKYNFLKYNHPYIVLRKATPTSAYCDEVSMWKVAIEDNKHHRIVCKEYQ